MAISTSELRDSLKNIGSTIKNSVADVLESSDFISRTIGMNNSYEDIMYIVQALGREPISLLGKDFTFIFDHVRRNYEQGTTIPGMMYGVDASGTGNEYSCPKFTFYKERPTIRFADPMTDNMNLLARWMPDFKLNETKAGKNGFYYAESHDDASNNIDIDNFKANGGTESGVIVHSIKSDSACDLIRKTNDNFKHGKYRTLIARFHTDSDDSKDFTNSTQTAISRQYGMSHGRNLLKKNHPGPLVNGYDNPYCRVWTYHHQYHTMENTIRPFNDIDSAAVLEDYEGSGGPVSFRTTGSEKFKSGSVRLDNHGVLNYENGLVNIAPKAKIKNYFDDKEDDKDEKSVSIKRCMFSIENLAWKGGNKGIGVNEFDPDGLSAEQRGPLGGRIMWFPPYDLKFNESSTAKWNPNEFIGRGENIYTYTNTERRGNLSFKLLIDHPSIVDYWDKRDGEEDYNGVDNVNSKESELLRFFAGCDILKAKPQKYYHREPIVKKEDKKGEEPKKQPENSEPAKEVAAPETKLLYCFVFYPNNYSGVDDGGIVNPIHYLLNGIGTQKTVNPSTKDAVDFGVDMSTNVSTTIGSGYGGYEMRSGKGISVATKPIEMVYDSIQASFADLTSKERKAQYLTNNNGQSISTATHILAKQVGDKADSLGSAKGNGQGGCSSLVTKEPHTWYRKRWYYRVDKSTENQNLLKYENYIDSNSFGFNSNAGLSLVKDLAQSEFRISFTENDTLVSLTDMYMALEKGAQDVFSGLYNNENVKLITEIFEKEKYKVTAIESYGHASSHNNTSDEERNRRNTTLAKNRATTFEKWLNKNGFPGADKVEYKDAPGVQEGDKGGDINAKTPKFWRSAHIVVKYEEVKEEPAQTVETTVEKDKEVKVDGRTVDASKVDSVTIPTSKTENSYFGNFAASQMGRKASVWQMETPTLSKPDEKLAAKYGTQNTMGIATESGGKQTPYAQVKANDIANFASTNYANLNVTGLTPTALAAAGHTAPPQPKDDNTEEKNNIVGYETKIGTVERYDNEGEFFKSLDKKDPFLHHLISEKIKYFDPAFHSISPEGFNARLTFLHQCTRQGPTVGNSDSNSLTAYNLAFGRPPVCVLRIGDFYYTKIIITSIDIDYDDMQWDLNPEGIGVMPMMANIKINFTFVGGSDLAGPISRLQNAVSFNYYANTGVYDNRAEMVEYDKDKSGKVVSYKPYVYPTVEPVEKNDEQK